MWNKAGGIKQIQLIINIIKTVLRVLDLKLSSHNQLRNTAESLQIQNMLIINYKVPQTD